MKKSLAAVGAGIVALSAVVPASAAENEESNDKATYSDIPALSADIATGLSSKVVPSGSSDILGGGDKAPDANDQDSDESNNDIAARVDELNQTYTDDNATGAYPDDSVRWIDRTDSSNIVIVAPHATKHHRDGKVKAADAYTGGMAELLGERLGASVLTTTGKVSDWGDDWEGRDDEFTRTLHNLPKDSIIVDLHGMEDDSSKGDVSIGTGDKPSKITEQVADNIREAFAGDTVVDGKFDADDSYTVTDHMQKRGYNVLQVEIADDFRDPDKDLVGHTIEALEKALQASVDGDKASEE